MNYLLYALIAFAFWAVSTVFDKILRDKYVKDSTVLATFFGILCFLPFLIMMPFIGITIPKLSILLASILAGFLMMISIIPYFKSLSLEEVSRVAPLWHFSPLFVLISAFIFLGEKLSVNHYIGFFILLFGGLLISTRKIKDIFKISKIFWLMLSASFLWAISEVLTKFIYKSLDYWNGIFWVLFGFMIGALVLILIRKNRENFKNTISTLNCTSLSFLIGSSLSGFFGRIFYFLAIMLGSVSLVSVISGFESVFVLIYAILLSKYLPKLFKEEIDKKTILHKIIAIFLMFIGLIFIYL